LYTKSKPSQLVNYIRVSLIASSISFCLWLLTYRTLEKALWNTLISLPPIYLGIVMTDSRRTKQEKRLKNSLFYHLKDLNEEINKLECYESQLYQSIAAASQSKQEIENNLQALSTKRNYLFKQISDLTLQQKEIQQFTFNLLQKKQEIQDDLLYLEKEIKILDNQKSDLLIKKQQEIQEVETCLSFLRSEYEQLQDQVLELYNNLETNY